MLFMPFQFPMALKGLAVRRSQFGYSRPDPSFRHDGFLDYIYGGGFVVMFVRGRFVLVRVLCASPWPFIAFVVHRHLLSFHCSRRPWFAGLPPGSLKGNSRVSRLEVKGFQTLSWAARWMVMFARRRFCRPGGRVGFSYSCRSCAQARNRSWRLSFRSRRLVSDHSNDLSHCSCLCL